MYYNELWNIHETDNSTVSGNSNGIILLIACMSSFLTPFTSSSVNIALPSIGKRFSLDAVTLSWVATAYLLAAAVFLVPFGRFADIFGRKLIFRTGIIIDAIALNSLCYCRFRHMADCISCTARTGRRDDFWNRSGDCDFRFPAKRKRPRSGN